MLHPIIFKVKYIGTWSLGANAHLAWDVIFAMGRTSELGYSTV
jgi:hypothetical protein